jgi:ankyrin repeat protein
MLVALSQLMQNEFGDTALIAAAQEGHIQCAIILLKYRADINYLNKVRLLYVHGQHG